jgi:prevent-host-death family protein
LRQQTPHPQKIFNLEKQKIHKLHRLKYYILYDQSKGGSMVVSSAKVQSDFSRYIDLASEQEIVITKNGLPVARLLGMKKNGFLSDSLVGLIPRDVNENHAKAERLTRQ